MKYRKKKGSDTCHWNNACSNWPASNYTEFDSPKGELCNECKGKD